MTYKPDIMIYHANCADGFGAAWAAWMKWGSDIEYVAASYGQEPPCVRGKHVLIGDFSYPDEMLRTMGREAKSIIVLDHHKSAATDLSEWIVDDVAGTFWAGDDPLKDVRWNDHHKGFPIAAIFDMERSGAVLTWQFCHEDAPPLLLRLIEDRDLWRFTMEQTKPFNVWLRCEAFDFAQWDNISRLLQNNSDAMRIFDEAAAMQRFFDQKVIEFAGRVRHVRVGGHVVPAVNCPPEFVSEVAHAVLAKHTDARFAAGYWDTKDGRSWSLRSDNTTDFRLDVADIARAYGGGGHRNAAGFTVPLP